jgi:ribosome-binding factor A
MANPRTIARLQARIRERAAYCLQFEISDPRAGFITITHVELSSDLSVGKIHYSVLGSEQEKNKAAHMLVSAAGYIQRQIARVLEMRRIPRLVWVYDDSVEKAADLDLLIREARQRDRAINPHANDEPIVSEGEVSHGATSNDSAQDNADVDEDGDMDADPDENDEPYEADDEADVDDEQHGRMDTRTDS